MRLQGEDNEGLETPELFSISGITRQTSEKKPLKKKLCLWSQHIGGRGKSSSSQLGLHRAWGQPELSKDYLKQAVKRRQDHSCPLDIHHNMTNIPAVQMPEGWTGGWRDGPSLSRSLFILLGGLCDRNCMSASLLPGMVRMCNVVCDVTNAWIRVLCPYHEPCAQADWGLPWGKWQNEGIA